MYIVDDPTLAMIARFVGGTSSPDFPDEEFFSRQLAAISEHVERFPPGERERQALAWIEANARQYRQQWQKQATLAVLANTRCPDCPLSGSDRRTPCAIHSRWLKLLQRYAANELSSKEYVEKSLALLNSHKDWLRVSQTRQAFSAARAASGDFGEFGEFGDFAGDAKALRGDDMSGRTPLQQQAAQRG